MQLSKIQPIIDEPALLLTEEKLLVIADLHIGIDRELQQAGVSMPSQTNIMEQRLISILATNDNIQDILLLGDIKHNIPSSTNQERTDVKKFLSSMQRYATLHVIPGNHDGKIDELLTPEIILHPSGGFVFKDIGFTHGHRWPVKDVMQCEQVIIAHTHPTVMLIDRLGYRTFEQCWLRGNDFTNKLKERYPSSLTTQIILMPAFNPLCGGVAVNRDPLLGPCASIIDVDSADLYLLDGSSLGKVKDLKESS